MEKFLSIRDHFEGTQFLTDEEKEIYNNTIITNEGLLRTYGLKIDKGLSVDNDPRFTLSIFGYFKEGFFVGGSKKHETNLKNNFPRQIYYTADKKVASKNAFLHWTLMQLIGFTENLIVEEDKLEKYIRICEKNLYKFKGAIEIEFFGLVITPVNILWVARSDNPINLIRESIRKDVIKAGLDLKEPYKVNIVHSCVLRFKNNLDVSKALEFSAKYRFNLRKKYTFNTLYLDYGSALMRPQEIKKIVEFDLVNKKTTKIYGT